MSKFLGVQLGSHSPFDEGIDHCLDTQQETAGITAFFVYATTYQRYGTVRDAEHHIGRGPTRRSLHSCFVSLR